MNAKGYTPAQLFRIYWEEFLTVETFAHEFGLSYDEALELIEMGRADYNLDAQSDIAKTVKSHPIH